MNKKGDSLWIFGKHPVLQILLKKQRKIHQILVNNSAFKELSSFLNRNGLDQLRCKIKVGDNSIFDSILGKSQLHQGFAVSCSHKVIKSESDLITSIESEKSLPNLLIIDQLTDPRNIGAIIRSASAFGVNKVIFPENNFVKENATISKSSSGALENIDLFMVINLNKTLEKLKKIGYWCLGLAGEGGAHINEIKDYKNIALIVGSEGSGIRPLVKKNCDLLVKIPISNQVESLNASVACSIALYEITRNSC